MVIAGQGQGQSQERTSSRSAIPDVASLLDVPELKGIVHTSSDRGWKKLIRPWNVRCSPTPFAVVIAETALHVSAAVNYAVAHGIAVQARSGGHSYGSYAVGGTDGTLVVDLSRMNDVRVHPEQDPESLWKAEIGPGARLGKVAEELYAQGKRAIAHGTCPEVGFGGHATIGGLGPLSRLWGLTLDHVVEVEAVLADGSIKTLNAENEPDIFWAIRGAAASFAIVTQFVVATHPAVTETEYYSLQYTIGPPDTLSKAFQSWQSYLLDPATLADRYFNCVCSFSADSFVVRGSRLEGPGPHAEKLGSMLDVHVGKHIRAKTTWKLDWVAHASRWAQDEVFNFFGGKPTSQYLKSLTIRKDQPLTEEATDAMFKYFNEHSPGHGLIWVVLADYELGRIADHASSATAYGHRDALYTLATYVIDVIPGRKFPRDGINFLQGWTQTMLAAMPNNTFGAYPGYIDPEIPLTESGKAYWGNNYNRLLEIKHRVDPHNVFRNPQSVGAVAQSVKDPVEQLCPAPTRIVATESCGCSCLIT